MKAYALPVLFCAAATFAWTLLIVPAPSGAAEPCPDVEVVFARGTDEAPGVGDVGASFVDSLRAHVGAKSVGVYPVNYPASMDFPRAVDGITDASAHIQQMATSCPKSMMVLGGYSQGAAVMGFVTANQVPDGTSLGQGLQPMPVDVANHVAAVVLFGKPSTQFMNLINQPSVTVGPLYAAKTIELCAPNDPICAGSGDFSAHRQYQQAGMIDQAADFTANRIAETTPPGGTSPTSGPTHPPASVHSPSPSPTPAPIASHQPGPPPGPAG
ncbi:cutinase [Mycobacterium montefiorense]|uniref:Cutinase n=1 Tax=Mycobacterium montefiorense TaxID=154654 RepID=A0AA37PJF1_9MYCO|nr:cutinase family protein [Mycobacterium montefiorense]GBG38826.1 cutinase [Mycobacterium montefiorense]GKU34654.1 cutinase [Mycobacterium montefiorense]GKU38135.1 cutinase [Mycobacterium montefiorense]GKU43423.1 cutinase [Mycobacterium montefiorense]GKU50039.1 cutinase [Mycobacterium montefiorense]